MADKKSSLIKIAQSVLDVQNQSIKVTIPPIEIEPPVGGATEAKQTAQIAELQEIKGQVDGLESSLISVDSKLSRLNIVGSGAGATALRVQLADESLTALENINVTVTNTALEITNDAGSPIPVSGTVTANTGLTQPLTDAQLRASAISVTGTVTANTGLSQPLTDAQLRSSAVPVSVASLPLPSGAATEASVQRLNSASLVRNSYSSTSVTTSAYVQLVASVASAVKEIEIFDSSGESLVLALGASGSESDKVYVFPGGNGRIPMQIAVGQRLSIKAVSANATSGELLINFYG